MSKAQKIDGTAENWESGALGRDEKHAQLSSDVDTAAMDEALGLQMISIRLQKSLLEDIKLIAKIHGLGYQALIKGQLRRFVDAEMKLLLRELADQKAKKKKANSDDELECETPTKRACA